MKVIDPALLDEFRSRGVCELCNRPGSDPDHWFFARGMGAGGQLDVPENLLTLCRRCHDLRHQEGRPSKEVLLLIVARREGKSVEEVEQTLYELRRRKK